MPHGAAHGSLGVQELRAAGEHYSNNSSQGHVETQGPEILMLQADGSWDNVCLLVAPRSVLYMFGVGAASDPCMTSHASLQHWV